MDNTRFKSNSGADKNQGARTNAETSTSKFCWFTLLIKEE